MTYEVSVDLRDVKIMPSTEIEEVLQNVQMILATMKLTVPLDREFGITANVIDTPISATQARLTAEVAAAVRKFEPRARVERINYGGNAPNGELNMTVVVEIIERNLRGGVHL